MANLSDLTRSPVEEMQRTALGKINNSDLPERLIPEVDAANEAGRLLRDLPRLWAGAALQERHQLLSTILDGVYIDVKDRKSIMSAKAKPAFEAVVGLAGLAVPFRIRDTCPDPPIASGSMTSNPMTSLGTR